MRPTVRLAAAFAAVFVNLLPQPVVACTNQSFSAPEIEIEVEFEDYNDIRNRLTYKIEVEAEIMVPTQPAVCQCGMTFGSGALAAPDSFSVLDAIVAVSKDDGDDFDLESFSGFNHDDAVEASLMTLNGIRDGATAFGFSTNVDPFNLPALLPGDAYVLGFLIEFAPEDFAQVNGNLIQFAAGSNEPGHPLNIFQRYQPNLRLPPFQLHACDFDLDQSCDINDLDAMYSLGRLDQGVERTDATEIYDLNGDDRVSFADARRWLVEAASVNGLDSAYDYGDANLDGAFESSDLVQVFQVGEYESGIDGQTWGTGDWTGDGLFSSSDLVRAFQTGAYENGNIAAVPEPRTQPLLVAAALCFVLYARRREASLST